MAKGFCTPPFAGNRTTEVKTGETWIDGKPIYRKVLTGTTQSSGATEYPAVSGSISIPVGASVDRYIKVDGWVESSSMLLRINCVINTYNSFVIVWGRNNAHSTQPNTIGVGVGSSYYDKPIVIIIEYTKTTD